MIRCYRCGKRIPRSRFYSDLATISLHWMVRHPGAWIAMHPESAPYLRRLP